MSQSIRARSSTSKQKQSLPELSSASSSDSSNVDRHDHIDTAPKTPSSPSSPSFSQRAISQTLTTTANLANLLPTGTLLAFQLLTPVFTNNGACDSATETMTFFLLGLLALSCFLSVFTDSVKSSDGKKVYYGIATLKGIFLFDCPDPVEAGLEDLKKYRIRFLDAVHGVLSPLVFAAFALKDKNVLTCFFPKPEHQTQEILNILPVGLGVICGLLFVVFPSKRQGIGYPVTSGQ